MIRSSRRRTLALVSYMLAAALFQVAGAASAGPPVVHKVGAITWHAAKFVGQKLQIVGYVLAKGAGYVLFSDEPTGKISAHDLPVIGPGSDQMQLTKKYVVEGQFIAGGFQASNGNPDHLELSAPPRELSP